LKQDKFELIAEAKTSLQAARLLQQQGFHGYAAARAYYSMFYVAQVFLLEEGKSYSKHSAVISAFGRDFSKTKRVDPSFHQNLMEAFELRMIGDYPGESRIDKETAATQIDRADSFLRLAERTFGEIGDAGD
jgi:uncharacterized protein (UPF0332 family)